MKKIDLYVPQDMPAQQRDVLACLPGEVNTEARVFKLNPQIRSVSSMFDMMDALPMTDPNHYATIEVADGSVGPFLATCARNKSGAWQTAYSKVSGQGRGHHAVIALALANEQSKAATAVDNFVEAVAPASMGYRSFDVPVIGTMRGETPLPYDDIDEETDEDRGVVNPSAEDFFSAARRGQVLTLEVGEARERQDHEVAASSEQDTEIMPVELQAEPTFLANFAATMSVVARDAEQAAEVARALTSGVQSPSEEVLQTVRDVFVPRSSMQFFKESIRADVRETPADSADTPRMR
jgi:hypothetical protein